jgi:hypothetical protein
MQAPFHQQLAFALVHQLDRAFGRRFAVRRIDDLKIADFDAMLAGDLFDPGGRPDKDRLDDPECRRLDRAAKRTFVARMHDNR